MQIDAYTRQMQTLAADPKVSAWVSANAGSGKTFVLTRRVVRLMLDGVEPSRILCLTFTKAAAAEMTNRIFSELGKWVLAEDDALSRTLEDVTGKRPNARNLKRARQLFAAALDTPGGLKIQTIHAFCEAILHQFPMEANIPGSFEVLDDIATRQLMDEARHEVLLRSASDSDLSNALDTLRGIASDDGINKALDAYLQDHTAYAEWLENNRGLSSAFTPLAEAGGIKPGDTPETLAGAGVAAVMACCDWGAIADDQSRQGADRAKVLVSLIQALVEGDDALAQFEILAAMFLKGDGKRKASFLSGGKKTDPRLVDQMESAFERFAVSNERIKLYHLIEATKALFLTGDAIASEFSRRKLRLGMLDYADMINKTASLLTRNAMSAWVQYKLDQNIEHVLVDEAQDTSPTQWQIISALTSEFYAGDGATDKHRTMFVVGDPKQSIYSFQGARPEEFSAQKMILKHNVSRAGDELHDVKLRLSFRSTMDVLGAVDRVFAEGQPAREGFDPDETESHEAQRSRDEGMTILWPMAKKQEAVEKDSWLDPYDKLSGNDPKSELATRIADQIGEWIGSDLPGEGRKVRAGDIMVLVRKRDAFAKALNRNLKNRGIAVAGADRLYLTEHVAIEDLIALGRVMLNREDDLSLAALLKSPIFGLDEDALFELAHPRERDQSLTSRLEAMASAGEAFTSGGPEPATMVAELDALRAMADSRPVFEFYAGFLGGFGGRKRLLQRLGLEAEEVLDAFLSHALSLEREGVRTLEAFLERLTHAPPEIKREVDMRKNEVRVITAHSSKGLEAPVIFLVDPGTAAFDGKHRKPIEQIDLGDGTSVPIFVPRQEHQISLTSPSLERQKREAEYEYRRLLYVGMTRAADRLIICGYANKNTKPEEPTWHSMVFNALHDELREVVDDKGAPIEWQWRQDWSMVGGQKDGSHADSATPIPVEPPEWLRQKPGFEAPLPRPITPSGFYGLIGADQAVHEPVSRPAGSDGTPVGANNFHLDKGNIVHRLLQFLPERKAADWQGMIDEYLAVAAQDWPEEIKIRTRNEILTLLNDPNLSDLFGPNSRAEVPIAGEIMLTGKPRTVSGQIDRLVVTDDAVQIIDFKTNTAPPNNPVDVPTAYLCQMAIYAGVMSKIYPGRKIVASLLWTATGRAMELPRELLQKTLKDIE